MSWLEGAIIAFIMLSIGYVVWKGGAANPESTGTLGRKVTALGGKVASLEARVGHMGDDLAKLEREAATTKDIERLEELGERTFRSVDRIERVLIEKGLGGK